MNRKKTVFIEYIRNYRFNSLFLKNFILISLVIYGPLIIICAAVYIYFSQIYMQEIVTSEQNTLHRIQELSDTVYENVVQTGVKLCENKLSSAFMEYDVNEWKQYEIVQDLEELRRMILLSGSQYVDSVCIYAEKSDYIMSDTGLKKREAVYDQSWYPLYQAEKGSTGARNWFRVMQEEPDGSGKGVLTTAFYLPYDERTEKTGVLMVNMDYGWLNNFLETGDTIGQEFLILDRDGNVLYAQEEDQTGQMLQAYQKENLKNWDGISGITAEGNHMVSIRESKMGSWEYVYVTPMEHYDEKISRLRIAIILASFILFLLSAAVSFGVSARVFLPVKNIIQMLEDPEKFYELQMNSDSSREQRNELKYIMNSLKEMVSGREKDREVLAESVTKLKQTQISLLQTQINPHFLFNTLQTVNFMAIGLTGTDNQVSDAIGRLSVMLRGMMRVNVTQGSLREEVEYCKAYIELEQLRYGERLQVDWKIDDDLLDCMAVRMMLQPVLENSIVHGFRNLKYGGKICVEAQEDGQKLILYVKDNGIGQSEEWIREMEKKLCESQTILGSHIGLSNVNQRIRLIFGNEYGVHVEQAEEGFAVRMEIPVLRENS